MRSEGIRELRNFIPLASFKNAVGMRDPEIKIEQVQTRRDGVVEVTLSARYSAAYVWVETGRKGHWSDNGFMWLVGCAREERNLLFDPAGREGAED